MPADKGMQNRVMEGYTLDIVMYHFVRDLANSRYPAIKGLDLELFRQQMDFFKSRFQFVNTERLLECMEAKAPLADNAVLLTFDDGYSDHYTNVFPILMERGIKAFFAAPGKIIREKKVLDVNKIHFLLAGGKLDAVREALYKKLDYYRGTEYEYPSNEELYEKLAKPGRFDNADTIFIKRVLQSELDERLRSRITGELFTEYVSDNEAAFVSELYLSYDQIKLMKNCGMYFGLHGYEHYWFEKLTKDQFIRDIQMALEVFDGIIDPASWVFCYPYGSHSRELLDYCAMSGCRAGFTTEPRVADLSVDNPLLLPRLDTNDYPPKGAAAARFI